MYFGENQCFDYGEIWHLLMFLGIFSQFLSFGYYDCY